MQRAFITGDWRVEPSLNQISKTSREGGAVSLEPRAMQVLCVLAREEGRVVSRHELIEEIWQTHVTDDAVSAAIYQIRRAFRDQHRSPRYLETVTKRGYRWLCPVMEVSQSDRSVVDSKPLSRTEAVDGEDEGVKAPVPSPRSLFFANRRAAGAILGLSLGLSVLSTWTWWASARTFLPEAEEGVRSELSKRNELSEDTHFHLAMKRGWYLLNQRQPEKVENAKEEFRRAIEVAPHRASGHAGLAASYCMSTDLGLGDVEANRKGANRSLSRAQTLGASTPEVHYASGLYALVFDLNVARAELRLRAAIQGDGVNPIFHGAMAWTLAAQDDASGAIASAQRALELDPTSLISYLDLAYLFAIARRFSESEATVESALRLEPASPQALASRAWVLAHSGENEASYSSFRRVLVLTHVPDTFIAAYDQTWQTRGLLGTLEFRAKDARKRAAAGKGSWLSSAQLHARIGQTDQALADLERAHQSGSRALPFLLGSPDFESLRDDPRFRRFAGEVRILSHSSADHQ